MLACAAADAIHAVGVLPNGNVQLAGLLTGTALDTFCCVNMEAVQSEPVKQTVNGAQRTQVPAEGAI